MQLFVYKLKLVTVLGASDSGAHRLGVENIVGRKIMCELLLLGPKALRPRLALGPDLPCRPPLTPPDSKHSPAAGTSASHYVPSTPAQTQQVGRGAQWAGQEAGMGFGLSQGAEKVCRGGGAEDTVGRYPLGCLPCAAARLGSDPCPVQDLWRKVGDRGH